MTRRTKPNPLALKISPVFHDYLMDTPAGREVRGGKVTGQYDPHLITALRKIILTSPRSEGTRQVSDLTVAELDALAPHARSMRTANAGNAGHGLPRSQWLAGEAAARNIAHLREILAADDPSQVSEQRYPLHNRLRVRQEEADLTVRLLDWLMSPGSPVVLAEPVPGRRNALRQANVNPRELVLMYLEIDPEELAREELRMRQHRS